MWIDKITVDSRVIVKFSTNIFRNDDTSLIPENSPVLNKTLTSLSPSQLNSILNISAIPGQNQDP